MNPSDAAKTILNTDFLLDKVISTFTGTFSAPARFGNFNPRRTSNAITHNAGAWCLINGAYSFDNTTWYPFGVNVADTSGAQPTFQNVEVNGYCTDSQVVVQASNWTTGSRTIYYALQLITRD